MDRNFTTIAMMIGSKGNEFEIVWETDYKISHENKRRNTLTQGEKIMERIVKDEFE